KRIVYDGVGIGWKFPFYFDRFELGGRPVDEVWYFQLFGSRWLVPSAGRFLTEGGSTGLNPYSFARNSKPNVGLDSDDPNSWLKPDIDKLREYKVGKAYDWLMSDEAAALIRGGNAVG